MNYTDEPHGIFFLIDNKSFYASVESIERGLNPLQSILVVMSEQANTNGGLVLATSPQAKKLFGIRNVDRWRDLPQDQRLLIVPPRMNLYIQKSLAINQIFTHFTAENDIYPYSIDESILDMTHSWQLFGRTPQQAARRIQLAVRRRLGLYTTVGIGENPIQAKLALDLFAKHSPELISELTYQNFTERVWPITDLTSVWSIGKQTAAHLKHLGIHQIKDLALTDPFELQKEFGIIGTQLFALAWGIDRSQLQENLPVKHRSLENSQVLPRDYTDQAEIEVVIREIGQQVASRLRHRHLVTSCIHLGIGFSLTAKTNRPGFAHELKIPATDDTFEINRQLLFIFHSYWHYEPLRRIGISLSQLSPKTGDQLNLFTPSEKQIKKVMFNQVIDQIRDRFGTSAIMYANSLVNGGTFRQRIGLVGGHNGGNSFE
ncbi:Y-family DNA polymerase [Liquorilactobacillus sicerae]|uniref:Y-family DNA polymerase n=1 Tax=Liquorilactobacillus sicerae TaxID=1416943 RepID=UPI0024818843|nr:Y-family DNA polymerase [Liquorilactobacillus sicerae]